MEFKVGDRVKTANPGMIWHPTCPSTLGTITELYFESSRGIVRVQWDEEFDCPMWVKKEHLLPVGSVKSRVSKFKKFQERFYNARL